MRSHRSLRSAAVSLCRTIFMNWFFLCKIFCCFTFHLFSFHISFLATFSTSSSMTVYTANIHQNNKCSKLPSYMVPFYRNENCICIPRMIYSFLLTFPSQFVAYTAITFFQYGSSFTTSALIAASYSDSGLSWYFS